MGSLGKPLNVEEDDESDHFAEKILIVIILTIFVILNSPGVALLYSTAFVVEPSAQRTR